jgi:hypothetical protein
MEKKKKPYYGAAALARHTLDTAVPTFSVCTLLS